MTAINYGIVTPAEDRRPIPTGILPDWAIRRYVPITPLAEGIKRPGVISYGLSSYGYDCRLGYKFKIFTPVFCTEVDPKAISHRAFQEIDLTPGVNDCARCPKTCE
jgi:deoxycytidine triphosphate deaminase